MRTSKIVGSISGALIKAQGFLISFLHYDISTVVYIYKSCITIMTLDYGSYAIFLLMGNAGFISSTVPLPFTQRVELFGFRV